MASVSNASSLGPGIGGGAGTGAGVGAGLGDGAGRGPGLGGGPGGGPFRPGTGIDPPRVVREVRPTYTADARRRGIEGDVTLEVVVSREGRVTSIRTVRGLGAGLDERAAEAVRQWRFTPARRQGAPVDVVVEVSVEFTLR
jgi:TonB family protein